MIMLPCECGGLPYIGQLIRSDDIFYVVYCMQCGGSESVDWNEDEALENWNAKKRSLSET